LVESTDGLEESDGDGERENDTTTGEYGALELESCGSCGGGGERGLVAGSSSGSLSLEISMMDAPRAAESSCTRGDGM